MDCIERAGILKRNHMDLMKSPAGLRFSFLVCRAVSSIDLLVANGAASAVEVTRIINQSNTRI